MAEEQINDLLGGIEACDGNNYTFIALRGIQAGREYYTVMCQLSSLPRLFMFDEKQLPPTQRAQRQLNRSRIPAICRYILEDPKNYVFSSITASIDGRVEFIPFSKQGAASKVGHLIVPQSARFLINDGQHRKAAIEEALKKMPEIGSEHISVVFFVDGGLKRSQQMFSDLNKHALRPTMSLSILYNHRESLSRLTKKICDQVPIFNGRIELEKSSISNRSLKLFTLSSLYQATKYLLGLGQKIGKISEKNEILAIHYWTEVSKHMSHWQLVNQGKASAFELRQKYVDVHGIVLQALGIAGRALLEQHPESWRERLTELERIDWSRENKLWDGRAINTGRITPSAKNVVLVAIVIKKALGLGLGTAEEGIEKDFQAQIRVE
jgi:DNA sulfur modification protein DndB